MKYEEIKVGDSYKTESGYTEKVLFKHDETRQVVTIDEDDDITSWSEYQLKLLQPIKKELPESGCWCEVQLFIELKDQKDLDLILKNTKCLVYGFIVFLPKITSNTLKTKLNS